MLHGRLEFVDECELIALVTAAACGISKCCSDDALSILSAVFSQLGDTLATVLACRELKEPAEDKTDIPPSTII